MHIINQELIDKVINDSDIVEEIAKDIDMVKKGSNFVGLCPFHDDNNPSFTVSPDKKIYKCFVCNEGGNIITYLQKKRQLSFKEAVAGLAKLLGIEVKIGDEVVNSTMHNLYKDTLIYYKTILFVSDYAKDALQYLKDRKISQEAIDFFELGYAIKENKLNEYLSKKSEEFNEYSLYDIENSKLFINEYEFFNQRLIVPIKDEFGRAVAFSGRTLKNETPKYINSKESNIFNKRNVLYNFNNAKRFLAESELIIVEGFFDVISLYQNNIKNVIALMGTSFSMQHISLLKRYKITKFKLLLDNDNAGINSCLKIGSDLYKNNILNIEVLVLKEFNDIDEYLVANNKFENIKSIDFIEFKIHALLKTYDITDINQQLKYIEQIKNDVKMLENNKRVLILNKISEILKIDVVSLKDMLNVTVQEIAYQKEIDIQKKDIISPIREIDYTKLVLSDEGVFVSYSLIQKEKFNLLNSEYKNGNIKFNRLEEVFKDLDAYYKVNSEFDVLVFHDMFGNDEVFRLFTIMLQMMKEGRYNFEKIPLLLNKKQLAGSLMFKKRV